MADEDTFELPIGGRLIWFKKSSEGQLVVLQRVLNRVRAQFSAATEQAEQRAHADRLAKLVLDAAESRFVHEADRDWVEEQLIIGAIDLPDIMPIFANGAMKPAKDPDDAPPPAKKANARKAAQVKKVANAPRVGR
jgi:hypothetical protein